MVSVITFISAVEGLKAFSLHSQLLEEYMLLSKHLSRLYVLTDTVAEIPSEMPPNLQIIKTPKIKTPKLYGITRVIFHLLAVMLIGCDLIYVRTFSPPELVSLWLYSKVLGKPSILVLPGTWLFAGDGVRPTARIKLFRLFLKLAIYSADKIVLYSGRMLREVVKYAPSLDGKKIAIVRNAVNVERFRKDARRPEAVEKIVGEKPYIYYVGRLNEKKGVLDLVEAYETVVKQVQECPPLLLFGEGTPEFKRKLESLIEEKKLSSKVVVAGPIPNDQVPGLAANSLFIVYASREGEGIPRAIVEAMACGRPAVATGVAGIPDLVRNGETGFLVKPRDKLELAEKIISLVKDSETREAMGAKARKLVENEFSYDVVIPKIAKLIKQAASSVS